MDGRERACIDVLLENDNVEIRWREVVKVVKVVLVVMEYWSSSKVKSK